MFFLFLGDNVCLLECSFYHCCIFYNTTLYESYNHFYFVFFLLQYKIWDGQLVFDLPYYMTICFFVYVFYSLTILTGDKKFLYLSYSFINNDIFAFVLSNACLIACFS